MWAPSGGILWPAYVTGVQKLRVHYKTVLGNEEEMLVTPDKIIPFTNYENNLKIMVRHEKYDRLVSTVGKLFLFSKVFFFFFFFFQGTCSKYTPTENEKGL